MLISPVKDYKITSNYGPRILNGKEEFHDGIDFISKSGKNIVHAIAEGVVCHDVDFYNEAKRWTDRRHSAGNYLIIKHHIPHNGALYYVRYMHLDPNFCFQGQEIEKGEPIGLYKDVGRSYGAHLHLDMYDKNWNKIDPSFILVLMEEIE